MRAILHRHNSDFLFVVIVVEATFVIQTVLSVSGSRIKKHSVQPFKWDCSKYLDDRCGTRLFEEILRRTHKILNDLERTPDGIAITLPGTLEGHSVVLRSTRLGIREPIEVSGIFERGNAPPCFVFHDTECLGIGEALHGALKGIDMGPENQYSFAYVFVDEGVGSTLFINGKAYKGAGSAGHLGRLVVDPVGQYNPTFSSRGSLEVFASRPWVSSNIVGQYLSEKGKHFEGSEGNESFRNAVLTASEKQERWNALTYSILTDGLRAHDPIAVSVIEDAAMYLGLAINCIITIVNPPAIIIGGEMTKELPGFYEKIVSYARRFSWRLAWNRTTIKRATLDRSAQILGVVEMLRKVIMTDE